MRHQLEHGSVWQDRDSLDNYDGLVREIQASPEERGEFAEAVAALTEAGGDIGAARRRGILEENLSLFRGVRSAVGSGWPALESAVRRFTER
ncbi:MAG: hypothetical protein JNM66_22865 [Bryobacterales bacterium]|nr:hypothetical protein [Bryobacterales bacterium]